MYIYIYIYRYNNIFSGSSIIFIEKIDKINDK